MIQAQVPVPVSSAAQPGQCLPAALPQHRLGALDWVCSRDSHQPGCCSGLQLIPLLPRAAVAVGSCRKQNRQEENGLLLLAISTAALLAEPKPSSAWARKAFAWSAALSGESSVERIFKERKDISIKLWFCT